MFKQFLTKVPVQLSVELIAFFNAMVLNQMAISIEDHEHLVLSNTIYNKYLKMN